MIKRTKITGIKNHSQSHNQKNHSSDKMVPKLRFPEFKDNKGWNIIPLGTAIKSESSMLAQNNLQLVKKGFPVYGASGLIGFISSFIQDEDYIAIIKDGSGVGKLFLYEKQSSILGTLTYLKSKDAETYYLNYLYYLLQTISLSSFIKGSGIPHIYYSDYSKELVATPTFEEQQKIASCLSSLDEVITAQSQKLEALKAHKKGLMQKLFPAEGERVPKLRFGEFRDSGEWEEKMLKDVCSNIASGKDKINIGGEFDLYGSTGVIGKTNDYSLDGNFILIARVGANAGLLTRANGKFGVTDNTLIVSLYDSENIDFIFYSLKKFELNNLVFGSGQPLITGGQLKNLVIPLPNTEEQQKIASCLSSLDELITAQTKKIEVLKMHKKGLMQGLFPAMSEL